MGEPIKLPNVTTPESHCPTSLKLLDMVKEARGKVTEQPEGGSKVIGWEVTKCEPYRFIGKSMYVRAGKSDEFCEFALWNPGTEWVLPKIDDLQEYATDDIHAAALIHWEKYDDKTKLMGYTIGRFMKADTPVPKNMDYIDIPGGYIAKGFVHGDIDSAINMLRDEIDKQGVYKETKGIWSAEVFPNLIADKDKKFYERIHGFYVPCELINPSQN